MVLAMNTRKHIGYYYLLSNLHWIPDIQHRKLLSIIQDRTRVVAEEKQSMLIKPVSKEKQSMLREPAEKKLTSASMFIAII